jgi:two-component system OmpR family sensor kinase
VERARRQLAHRAADDFSPLAGAGLPDEVRPLVDELNLLFGRVRSAFDAQKTFVADAAHELRSPLTALKLQAQALRPNGQPADITPAEREAGIARLNQGIDRAIRLVEQLLVLAREEAGQAAAGPPVDLDVVVRLAVADVLPQARLKQIDLGVAETPALPAPVRGEPEALRVLLRNLLDNAVKYTPPAGRVDVSLAVTGGRPVLTVQDSGPGIAPEERERVFDRFYRATGSAGETGSGLGLAIVQVIAGRHGATLELGRSEQLGGLLVSVTFPPTATAG